MRNIPDTLSEHLAQDATTLCFAWQLCLKDGVVLGYTDHDRDLVFSDITHKAASGLTPGAVEARLGFSTDNGFVQGALSAPDITEEDIANDRLNGAVLKQFRVNWQTPTDHVLLASGRVGQIKTRGAQYELEWVGHGAVLDRSIGRVFSRFCDAEFGDDRCGLNAADFPDGTVCPRSYKACQEQFSNTDNFRGFPFIIGDDALQSGLQEGEIRDGGSRFRS